jgi:hypothetical protein
MIIDQVRGRRKEWNNHIKRMTDNRVVKITRRSRGRPRGGVMISK